MPVGSRWLAFVAVLGCAAVIAWLAADLSAQSESGTVIHVCLAGDGAMRVAPSSGCAIGLKSLFVKVIQGSPPGNDEPPDCGAPIDDNALADLERRVKELEEAASRGELGHRVVAPFEVVNKAGQRIFYVEEGYVRIYNSGGADVARIGVTSSGGTFVGSSSSGALKVAVGAGARDGLADVGLRIVEGSTDRVTIGKVEANSYIARFYSRAGTRVAGIGQSQAGRGAVYVADTAGTVRGVMRIGDEDKGVIAVANASGTTLLELTQGQSQGGRLRIWDSAGKEPMVEAGVDPTGFGVVRAGPEGFKPGLGLLGLPASFIAGKPR